MRLEGDFDLALRVLITIVLSCAVGAEREWRGHPAGLRTMALVGVGSCLFSSFGLSKVFAAGSDPTRIAAQVVTGVGFLGAGAIMRDGISVHGLTTAATIWVVAAFGMGIGFGFYVPTIFSTFMVLVTLLALKPLERHFFHRHQQATAEGRPPPRD